MTVRYPIAVNAEAALNAPLERAGRQREAEALAGAPVAFVRELSGPAFETREAALAAYGGRLDTAGSPLVPPEDRYCELLELVATDADRAPAGQAQPMFAGGSRWPEPGRLLNTTWRLSVAYWRPLSQTSAPLDQARQARRADRADRLDVETLRLMARQPLKPVKPQQPLDIGLFETPLPENPEIIIPDE